MKKRLVSFLLTTVVFASSFAETGVVYADTEVPEEITETEDESMAEEVAEEETAVVEEEVVETVIAEVYDPSEEEADHEHVWETWVVEEASCVMDGLMEYYCIYCEESYLEDIPAYGHSFNMGYCEECGQKDPDFTLSAPKNLNLSYLDDVVEITFTGCPEADGYYVYRKDGTDGSYKRIADVDAGHIEMTCYDDSVLFGHTYFYKVKAYMGYGNDQFLSKYSQAVSIEIESQKLIKPKLSISSVASTSVTLKWKKVKIAAGYYIYRSDKSSSGFKKTATITDPDTLKYTVKGLTTGKKYYFKIYAFNDLEKGPESNIVNATPAYSAVKLKSSIKSSKSMISFSWEACSYASGYYVYRKKNSDDTWKRIATVSSSVLSYKDSDVSGSYYYSVIAYKKKNGEIIKGKRSESIRTKTLRSTTNVDVKQYKDTFKSRVSWNTVTGASAYEIYYKVGEKGDWTKSGSTDSTSYLKSQTHGKHYYYKVRAVYKNNGYTTYGPYKEYDGWYIIYYEPSYRVIMLQETYESIPAAAMLVKNTGSANMRIYSRNAKSIDYDYYDYDRDMYMVDEDINLISYIDIKPGEEKYVNFIFTSDTWYDINTTYEYEFRYDNVLYRGTSSVREGSYYYLLEEFDH